MKIEQIEIDKIIPYINNPRKNLNSNKVASSIKEFGWQQPIVVDKEMKIIVGHTRFEAAKILELKTVPVHIADLPPLKAKAYRIADNRLNEDSSWDFPLLNVEFTDLMDNHFDVENLGFDTKELENLITYNSEFTTEIEQIDEFKDDTETDDIVPAQVRMVQLFLDSETEPNFRIMIDNLKKIYGTENVTDTVYKAIENENNNNKE